MANYGSERKIKSALKRRDMHVVFAEVLAFELDVDLSPEFVAACDCVLIRLWMEGLRLAPVTDEEEELCS